MNGVFDYDAQIRAVLRGGVFEALMLREWGPQRRRRPSTEVQP